jgi:hypothetical protein
MVWDPPEIETDEDAVSVRILDGIGDQLPGWVPVEGAPEVALAEEIGREAAATNTKAVESISLAVAGAGETMFSFPAQLGTSATIAVDITVPTVGDIVPAGFTVVGTNPVGVEVAFTLLEAVTAPTTTFAAVMTATAPGTAYNGVPAGALVETSATATVSSVVATADSSGGSEAETYTTYLARLVDYLSVLRPGGVRADDLAVLARSVDGVGRAYGLDLYNALSLETDSERSATVFVVGPDGLPASLGVKADVLDVLEGVREPNFLMFVEDPTYTPVDVVFTATADPGANPATVEADVIAAIAAYIDPASWGSTTADPETWELRDTVRLLDVATVAGAVAGVASLLTLTLNGSAADVTLSGLAPLPSPLTGGSPSSVAGTVT